MARFGKGGGAPRGNRNAAKGYSPSYGKWIQKETGISPNDSGWKSSGYSLKAGKTITQPGLRSGYYNTHNKLKSAYRDTTSRLAKQNMKD